MQTHKTTDTDKQTLPEGVTAMPGCRAAHRPADDLAEADHNRSQVTELGEASTIGMMAPIMQVASPVADGLDAMRQLLSSDRLNVIGENHDESGTRRADETFIAREVANGEYWLENSFIQYNAEGNPVEGDPWALRVKQYHVDIRDLILPGLNQALKNMVLNELPENLYVFIQEGVVVCGGLLDEAESFLINEELHNPNGVQSENVKRMKKLSYLAAQCKKSLTAFNDDRETELNSRGKMIDLKRVMDDVYKLAKFDLDDNENFESVAIDRSFKMHNFANKYHAEKGIWKIGNHHYRDIKRNTKKINYTLIGQKEFNNAWNTWKSHSSARPESNPNHVKMKQHKGWCAGFPCCCLGWCR